MAEPSNLKVRVHVPLVVEVDPDAWDLAYSTGTGRKAIVDDVRAYVLDMVQNCAAAVNDEAITGVKVKR